MANNSAMRAEEVLSFGPFRLSSAGRILYRDDKPVPLGSRALDILIALVERAGETVSRRDLMNQVWPDLLVEDANLRVHVTNLRKALLDGRDGARYVTNVPGRGYCFVAPVKRILAPQSQANPGLRHSSVPPCNLPPRLERMVGRDETVLELSRLLLEHRFVSVVGAGGLGKTTVATAVCHSLLHRFDGAVHFVDLSAISDGSLVGNAVESVLGLSTGSQDCLESLVSVLAGKQTMLVLDNCEHVIDRVAPLAEKIFASVSDVFILATSRETLRVEDEHVYLLHPLDAPPAGLDLTADRVVGWPAAQLFMERAAAGGYRLQLSDDEAPAVASICRQLDGLALAIELVASRVGAYGIQGTADLLENRFKLLWEGRRSALPRHQTMRALLDWSYHLLSEHERRVLCRLSVFAGLFPPDAAQGVVADEAVSEQDAAEALAGLIDKSLIEVSAVGSKIYYRLLNTTRSYAMLKIEATGERDIVAGRHALYYRDMLRSRSICDVDRQEPASYRLHMGNIRAALEWCFSHGGDNKIGGELAVGAAPLFLRMSLLSECRHWCEHALAALEDSDRGGVPELVLRRYLTVSIMFTRGEPEDIRHALQRGLDLAETVGTSEDRLYFNAGLHLFLIRGAEFSGAAEAAERSAVLAADLDRVDAKVAADWMRGTAYHLIGDQRRAQHHCEAGFRRAASLGQLEINVFGYDHRVRSLAVLARVLWLRGFPEQAERTARQAIEEAERCGHPVSLCATLFYTISVALWDADYELANRRVERLVAHAAKHSLASYHAIGLGFRGELAVCRGGAAAGVVMLRDALAALHQEQHHMFMTAFQRALAEGLAVSGQAEEAANMINGALARATERGETYELPDLMRAQGEILLVQMRPDAPLAEELLLRSLAMAREQCARGWELRTAIPLARLWLAQGRSHEVDELLGVTLQQFGEGLRGARLLEVAKLRREVQRSISRRQA